MPAGGGGSGGGGRQGFSLLSAATRPSHWSYTQVSLTWNTTEGHYKTCKQLPSHAVAAELTRHGWDVRESIHSGCKG